MRILITNFTAACITATLLCATPAQASNDTPIYRAASEYREAVRDFERSVVRSRYLNRTHKRVADDMEDSTSRLRRATRNPHRTERLFDAWDRVQYLQQHADVTIMSDPTCPAGAELIDCWHRVLCAYNEVAREMALCGWIPPHLGPPIYHNAAVHHNAPVDHNAPVYGSPIREHSISEDSINGPSIIGPVPSTAMPPAEIVPLNGSDRPRQSIPNRDREVVSHSI
jgi:hypothetical protein